MHRRRHRRAAAAASRDVGPSASPRARWRRGVAARLGGWALALATASAGACYNGEFLAGRMCQSSDECGPSLECVDGVCGGLGMSTSTTTDAATTSGTAGSGSSTTAAACLCEAWDILFVIDHSVAMAPHESKVVDILLELYPAFIDAVSETCSPHIGFTFTSGVAHNPAQCQGIGSLLTHNGVRDCAAELMGGRPYVDETDPLDDAILCLASAGAALTQDEAMPRPIDAILGVLDPAANEPGGCNEGFFRPHAPLSVFLITNTDDNLGAHGYGAAGGPNDWILALMGRNENDLEALSILAILGPEFDELGCAAEGSPRLHLFTEKFIDANELTVSICEEGATIVQTIKDMLGTLSTNACPT